MNPELKDKQYYINHIKDYIGKTNRIFVKYDDIKNVSNIYKIINGEIYNNYKDGYEFLFLGFYYEDKKDYENMKKILSIVD